jgi:hypothetical protein
MQQQELAASVQGASQSTLYRWLPNNHTHSKKSALSARFALVLCALFWALIAAVVSFQILNRAWSMAIDIGGYWDGPYLEGFYGYERNQEGRYRWSKPNSEIYLPGIGEQTKLLLRVHGGASGKTITVVEEGESQTIHVEPGWRQLHLMPQSDWWSGDARFELHSPVQEDHDRRELGFVLDDLRVVGSAAQAPIGQTILIAAIIACATILGGWSFRQARIGALFGAVLTVSVCYLLSADDGAWRLYLTDYTGRLLLVLSASLGLAWFGRHALGRVAQRLLPMSPKTQHALLVVMVLAFFVRFAALAYPLNFPSDLRFNLSRAWMVMNGQFLELFLPNSDLTPVQWQSDITVPRTPYYYLAIAPLTALPGDWPELSVMALSSLVDSLAVLLLGLIVVAAGGSRSAATLSALCLAIHPFALVTVTSWGIYTTLLGQACVLLTCFLWLIWRPRLAERRVQIAIAGAMLAAFLSHPAILLLFASLWSLFIATLLLRRDSIWKPSALIIVYASLAAFLLYYGWHTPELIRRSLPTVFEALNGGQALNTDAKVSAIESGAGVVWPMLREMYGNWLLSITALGGLLYAKQLWEERNTAHLSIEAGNRSYLGLLLLLWLLIYPPFALVDARVALNYKHVLFMIVPIAVLVGWLYGSIARFAAGRLLVGVSMALIAWQGISLVIDKIMYAYISLR